MIDLRKSRVLIVGYGSIGRRHEEVLAELGCIVAVVSRRKNTFTHQFSCIRQAVEAWQPNYVVIASRTAEHSADLDTLAEVGFTGKVLVEKPIFAEERAIPANNFSLLRVGFNLRCHPVMTALMEALSGHKVLAAHGYVGQHLPSWRPHQDYRLSYSANAEAGGGVLRDLSHDIDIMKQIAGEWKALTALGGKVSGLDITSDDCFGLLFQSETCPVATLNMNYLDHHTRREYLIHCDDFSLKADFINDTIEKNGKTVFHKSIERNQSYSRMHELMLYEDGKGLCSASEGIHLIQTIAAARKAAKSLAWKHSE